MPDTAQPAPNHEFLRFRVPSLDGLLAGADTPAAATAIESLSFSGGIDATLSPARGVMFNPNLATENTTSLCLLGPDGTGKSILALHLAAAYAADTPVRGEWWPRVIYASTDLGYGKAGRLWKDFRLGENSDTFPNPFRQPILDRPPEDRIRPLTHLLPNRETPSAMGVPFPRFLQPDPSNIPAAGTPRAVAFLDFESTTAGDDWAYLTHVVAGLPAPSVDKKEWPHVLVIDAVEGMLTLGGEYDSHGQPRDRRSRVTQLLRAAKGKCHLCFVCESAEVGRLPEEYVADAVFRLRARVDPDGYSERTVEVVKARGQRHVRGEHPYAIRDGGGSTTDDRPHPDDPQRDFSYVVAFRSLHSRYRDVMAVGNALAKPGPPPGQPVKERCRFGLPHLDALCGGGLPAGSVNAIIGEGGTYKSRLSRRFLAGAFLPGSLASAAYITTEYLAAPTGTERLGVHLPRGSSSGPGTWAPLIYRRLELHHTTSEGLFHVIERAVAEAKAQLVKRLSDDGRPTLDDLMKTRDAAEENPLTSEEQRKQLAAAREKLKRVEAEGGTKWPGVLGIKKIGAEGHKEELHRLGVPAVLQHYYHLQSVNVRVVIDDWAAIQQHYPRVRRDPLFLPFLVFFLRVENVTALIVETQAGGDTAPLAEQELAALAQVRLYTRRVDFYGRPRTTLRVIPPSYATGAERPPPHHSLELRPDGSDTEGVTVDPGIEVYEFVGGQARRIGLKVQLCSALADQAYWAALDDTFWNVLGGERPAGASIVEAVTLDEYENRRDAIRLLGGAEHPHTLVVQVDEFWSRSNSHLLCDLEGYWGRALEGQSPDDPYRLFNGYKTRANAFVHKYRVPPPLSHFDRFDRIPYLWDFGFLLCRQSAWERARDRLLHKANAGENRDDLKVGQIWEQMLDPDPQTPLDWRTFLAAARDVARADGRDDPAAAFGVDGFAAESLSCLLLEVWLSEAIHRHSETVNAHGALQSLTGGQISAEQTALDLSTLVKTYPRELYLAFLLLSPFLRADSPGARAATATPPVAARHWYSTACRVQDAAGEARGDLRPVRLPGRLATRGDWFLAVAAGSRSLRLGERALDLLSSRRGHVDRYRLGIGLPSRHIVNEDNDPRLYSRLVRRDRFGDVVTLHYRDICRFGADGSSFHWLWRSRIPGYDRVARPWGVWLRWMIRSWSAMVPEGERHADPFRVYDSLRQADDATWERYTGSAGVTGGDWFCRRIEFLLAALRAASDGGATHPPADDAAGTNAS